MQLTGDWYPADDEPVLCEKAEPRTEYGRNVHELVCPKRAEWMRNVKGSPRPWALCGTHLAELGVQVKAR